MGYLINPDNNGIQILIYTSIRLQKDNDKEGLNWKTDE